MGYNWALSVLRDRNFLTSKKESRLCLNKSFNCVLCDIFGKKISFFSLYNLSWLEQMLRGYISRPKAKVQISEAGALDLSKASATVLYSLLGILMEGMGPLCWTGHFIKVVQKKKSFSLLPPMRVAVRFSGNWILKMKQFFLKCD